MADDAAWRADAALVYRHLRDVGPSSAVDLADACFPTPVGGPESSLVYLQRRSYRRVIDAIVWMRHQGVVFTCVPARDAVERSMFHLGAVPISVAEVYRPGIALTEDVSLVTAEVSQAPASDEGRDAMDVWHGG